MLYRLAIRVYVSIDKLAYYAESVLYCVKTIKLAYLNVAENVLNNKYSTSLNLVCFSCKIRNNIQCLLYFKLVGLLDNIFLHKRFYLFSQVV